VAVEWIDDFYKSKNKKRWRVAGISKSSKLALEFFQSAALYVYFFCLV
jgi:hypothetical protein